MWWTTLAYDVIGLYGQDIQERRLCNALQDR